MDRYEIVGIVGSLYKPKNAFEAKCVQRLQAKKKDHIKGVMLVSAMLWSTGYVSMTYDQWFEGEGLFLSRERKKTTFKLCEADEAWDLGCKLIKEKLDEGKPIEK